MRGPLASAVQGLRRVASTCWWLVDRNQWFQLELFQFERPLARLMADGFRPCDIGYARIGVWVADFDQTLTRLGRLGSRTAQRPGGPPATRRACVRNPDGVYVEIMEDDPLSGAGLAQSRSECPVAVRSVTLSVPDLARSEAFFRRDSASALRCGAASARARGTLGSGRRADPQQRPHRRQRPGGGRPVSRSGRAGSPGGLPDLDQGILNIAFGARRKRDHPKLYRRDRSWGAREPQAGPQPGAGVVYVNDPEQFSVELLWMSEPPTSAGGSRHDPAAKRPRADTHAIEQTIQIAAPAQATWDVIADHETMSDWIGLGSVRRTVDGEPDPDGRGSERLLKLLGRASPNRCWHTSRRSRTATA